MRLKNIPTSTIAILLIVIVGIFALNEYVYIHKHICKDDRVVIHAHPYNKSTDTEQNKSHQHTEGDLVFLASMQTFITAVIISFIAIASSVEFIYTEKKQICQTQFIYLFNKERAPPNLT